jgi:hypothetical protein
MPETVRRGDKLHTPKGMLAHAGVYVGPIRLRDGTFIEHAVVHNSKARGCVVAEPFDVFCPTAVFTIAQRAAPGSEDLVVARALELEGKVYDLLAFNCEHAASLAQTGRAESPQLTNWVLGIAAASAAAYFAPKLVSTIKNGPAEYDPTADRNRYARTGRFARS